MKEELRKLDEINAQVNYLAKNCIETLDDLLSAREAIHSEMDTLTDQRTKLQNKIEQLALYGFCLTIGAIWCVGAGEPKGVVLPRIGDVPGIAVKMIPS